MVARTVNLATLGGGATAVTLVYDSVTLAISSIAVVNASRSPVRCECVHATLGVLASIAWTRGESRTELLPGGVIMDAALAVLIGER